MYSGSYWRTAVILDDSSLQDVLLEENDQLVISFLEQHVMVYFFIFHLVHCSIIGRALTARTSGASFFRGPC